MTATIRVFVKPGDPYSVRACTLLRMKGVAFTEHVLPQDEALLRAAISRSDGELIVPTVLTPGGAIEGFDQLGSLDLRGELDSLLQLKVLPRSRP